MMGDIGNEERMASLIFSGKQNELDVHNRFRLTVVI